MMKRKPPRKGDNRGGAHHHGLASSLRSDKSGDGVIQNRITFNANHHQPPDRRR